MIGDIRRMRNDVLHHDGIATVTNTGKCKLVRIHPGARIILTPDDIRFLLRHLIVKVSNE